MFFYVLALLATSSNLVHTTNPNVFKRALSSVKAEPENENYLNLIERLMNLKYNDTCHIFTKDGICLKLTEVKSEQLGRVHRDTSANLSPRQLATNFILGALKTLTPLKSKIAQSMFSKSNTANATSNYQYIFGATVSNSILLNKIGNIMNTSVNIQKGSSILTLIMFLFSMFGACVFLFKYYKAYQQEKRTQKQAMLEQYYLRRRGLDTRQTNLSLEDN